ncbi:fibronectin type III domain-containing protein [Myxococcus stipitatus DSM 14675]|uniref:Fibronectin type III domain-containing protein n=1 Tax=Myxococcus stipitatus (strain DSM 14675 / JCM 12634 / Mx s8) TaxID=1278073 RepID=L7U3T5_MYXSD|nr:CARDB domain-containing protein [Myxococcus stipitatus]AGC42848.1 fibronectin type III domain-containing protein [Myxococcus stipitatus DSM 14675]
MMRREWMAPATGWWVLGLLAAGSVGCSGGEAPSGEPAPGTASSALIQGPDLVITGMEVPPSLRMGPYSTPATASVKVCNQGLDPSPSTRAQLYVSMDVTLTPMFPGPVTDQAPLGFVDVPPLAPGQCATRSNTLSAALPPDAQGMVGGYYVGAIIDEQASVAESREDNNTFVKGLVGIGDGVDLVVTAIGIPESLRANGPGTSSVPATVTVCNQGTLSTQSTSVNLYASMDDVLMPTGPGPGPGYPPATDQAFLGSVPLSWLDPGQCRTLTTSIWPMLPPDAQGMSGAYYVGAIIDEQGSVPELREDNNIFVKGLVGMGQRPDLIITELKVAESLRTNGPGSAPVTVKVCNQGTDPSPMARARLYVSMDKVLTPMPPGPGPQVTDQVLVADIPVSNLAAGQCRVFTDSLWPMLPPDAQGMNGAYYVGAIVDEQDWVAELREDNNTFVTGPVGMGQGPDLVVTDLVMPESFRANSGASQTPASVSVCNRGTEPAPMSRVQLYVSMDAELTPMMPGPGYPPMDQAPLGMVDMPNLAPGQCATRSTNVWPMLPPDATTPNGAYYVGAIIDEQGSVMELREDNNIFVKGLVGIGLGPDLVVTAMVAPASLAMNGPGAAQTPATVTVCNQGTEPSASANVSLYVSMDAVLTPMGPGPFFPATDQSFLQSFPAPGLQPKQCKTLSTSFWPVIPADAQGVEGAYYLAAIVDEQRAVPELREDNNIFVKGLVGIGQKPDLIITEVKVAESLRTSGPGGSSSVTVKVCNQGFQPSSPTQVGLYVSMDKELTPMSPYPGYMASDQAFIRDIAVSGLVPGYCKSFTEPFWGVLPPDAQGRSGSYYVGAIVDEQRSVLELREDNNTFVTGPIGVGQGPDLVITSLVMPNSFKLSGPPAQSAKVTVCNRGTEFSPQSRVHLFVSTEAVLAPQQPAQPYPPTSQSPLGFVDAPGLAPGQCSTRSTSFWPGLPPDAQGMQGGYYVGAIIDGESVVQELREDNNTFMLGKVAVGDGPDLVVNGMSIPASAQPGQPFSLTVRACNLGTMPSPPTQARLYISLDAELTPMSSGPGPAALDQTPIGQLSVPSLGTGQCLTISGSAPATLPPDGQAGGVYYVGVVMDEPSSVVELREDNNAYAQKTMSIGVRPDLVIKEVLSPASALPNQSIPLGVRVCNQGTQSSPSTQARFYLSVDDELSFALPPGSPMPDQAFLAQVSVPSLQVGACLLLSTSGPVTLPPDAQGDGRYFLGAIIDESLAVNELREDNNTFAKTVLGVGAKPDLVITEMSGPTTIRKGGFITTTIKVCNQGTQLSSGSAVRLSISMDQELAPEGPPPGPDQLMLAEVSVDALVPGACTTRGWSLPAQLPPDAMDPVGDYFVAVSVDPYQQVGELREDNNIRFTGLTVTP